MRLGWCYCFVEEEYREWRFLYHQLSRGCMCEAPGGLSIRNPLCLDESEIRTRPKPLSKCSALLFIKKKTEFLSPAPHLLCSYTHTHLHSIIQSAPSSLITFTCVPLLYLSLSFILLHTCPALVLFPFPASDLQNLVHAAVQSCWDSCATNQHSPAEFGAEFESASRANLQLALAGVTSCFQETL